MTQDKEVIKRRKTELQVSRIRTLQNLPGMLLDYPRHKLAWNRAEYIWHQTSRSVAAGAGCRSSVWSWKRPSVVRGNSLTSLVSAVCDLR
jgi:hypothetical protein